MNNRKSHKIIWKRISMKMIRKAITDIENRRYNMSINGVPEKEMEQEIEYTQRLRHKYII